MQFRTIFHNFRLGRLVLDSCSLLVESDRSTVDASSLLILVGARAGPDGSSPSRFLRNGFLQVQCIG